MALGSDTSTKYDRVVFLQNVKSLLQNVSALLKRDPNTCFPAKSKNFLRTAISKNIIEPLLLITRKQLRYVKITMFLNLVVC